MRTVPALLLVVAIVPRLAAAQAGAPSPQEPAVPVATFRTEVIVTAERASDERDGLSVATGLATRQQLERLPGSTLADAVTLLPGLHILSSHGSGIPPSSVVRGFFGGGEAEYVKVLVDGIPIGDLESGLVDWRRVPIFAIDRIEALRGPASAVYGDTALGGVVQVFTQAPRDATLTIDASGGQFGFGAAGLGFGRSFGGTSMHALASYDRSEGFRAHSALRESFGSVSVDRTAGSHRWGARGSINYSDREEPGALTAAQLANDREASDSQFRFDQDVARRGHVALRYAFSRNGFTSAVLGHAGRRSGERVRTLLLGPGLGDRADRDLSSTTAGLSLENSLERTLIGRGRGRLTFGLDVTRGEIDTVYHAVSTVGERVAQTGNVDGRRLQLAGYAAQSVTVGDRATLHAGVRWDGLRDRATNATIAHDAWSPRAGAAVSLGRGTVLFGQVSRAFKAPTLDQLFDPRPFPDFRGGTFLISTPNLRPQRAVNVEGGVRQSMARARWEAVVYRMRVRDEIDFNPSTLRYANIGRSVHEGVETDVSAGPFGWLAFTASYAWTRVAPQDVTDAGQLKNIPRHILRPGVTLVLPREFAVHLHYTRTAGAFADDHNEVPMSDRSTVDLRVSARASRITIRLDLLNITNDRYEEVGYVLSDFRGGEVSYFYPAPGFAARAGMQVRF